MVSLKKGKADSPKCSDFWYLIGHAKTETFTVAQVRFLNAV